MKRDRRCYGYGAALGLIFALVWGMAIACVQLRLTWELTGFAGFIRPPQFIANYLFPPAHWAQFALPEVFLARSEVSGDAYWGRFATARGEACAYVGIVPLILACVGWVSTPRGRALLPWKGMVLISLALATMPGWWPDAFFLLMQLPGLGWFRAPARYTLLTSLGLALLAGHGLDYDITSRRFYRGLALAILIGTAAWAWSIYWARRPDFESSMGPSTVGMRFLIAALVWFFGLTAIVIWRRNRTFTWVPILLAAIELCGLFYLGPIRWRSLIRLPEASPVLRQLATLPDVGLVGGRLQNLAVDAGQTTAYPYLGITPPPPTYLLEPTSRSPGENTTPEIYWQHRFGVSHGIWAVATTSVR